MFPNNRSHTNKLNLFIYVSQILQDGLRQLYGKSENAAEVNRNICNEFVCSCSSCAAFTFPVDQGLSLQHTLGIN